MNTIKIYLDTSGEVAHLYKDFQLYQHQFQNKLLNVYVPTSILAPDFRTLSSAGQTLSEYVAGTAVKIGMTYLTRSGEQKVAQSHYMRYLKTLTYQNVEYALFERKLPKEFTLYAGQGDNAPKLVINVVNIEMDTDPPKILSLITSQVCRLDVMPSSNLDNEETIEPSELDMINARLTAIDETLAEKQDKVDESINLTTNQEDETTWQNSQSVVGAINNNTVQTELNRQNIVDNTAQININTNDIDILKKLVGSGETYIGRLTGSTLPTNEDLYDFVYSKVGRQPKNDDVVIFVLEISGETDKNYKYIYAVDGWTSYEIPPFEEASNGSLGLIEGTYAVDATANTIVNISGGKILDIYVKDNSNIYRNIREYLNTTTTNISNIINGDTSVGLALKAVADGLGNNIVNTYLTQTAGATKQYVRDYALPREFNDIFYISSDGYSKEEPTSVNPQFSVETDSVGDFTLFSITKTNDCDYELSRKNSCNNVIYVSANRNCTVNFRLTTEARKIGQNWTTLDVQLTTETDLVANTIQKIDFLSIFSYLGNEVLDLKVGDNIRQILEVVTQESTATIFNVYSNETYPSIFNINTTALVIYHNQGNLGEIPVYDLTGVISGTNIAFDFGNEVIYRNTLARFILRVSQQTQLPKTNTLNLVYNTQNVRIVTPYNRSNGSATISNLEQTNITFDAVNGTVIDFVGFINIDAGNNITVLVNEDDLTNSRGLFYCTYGTTEYLDILDAVDENKLPICIYDGVTYMYYGVTYSPQLVPFVTFSASLKDKSKSITVDQSNIWREGNVVLENVENKIESITGRSATNYTSERAVYDYAQPKLTQPQLDAVNSGIDSTKVGQITTNANDISTINLKIPSTASSSNKMTVRNEVVGSVDLSINSSTYVITLQCKDVNGNNLGSAKTIDLPLESVVVNGSYDSTNKKVILTLQNGSTIEFSVADLVSGLQTEITSSNKLESDLVDDTNQLHKFMTAGEKTQISTNATNIAGLQISKQDALKTSTVSDGIIAKNMGFDSQGNIVKETPSSGDSATWGNITGTLSNQTDLYNALAGKQDMIDASHKVSADYISNGTNNKVFTATEQTKLSGIESGAQVNTVTSVNTKTGAVVLDADDISDTNTDNKFVSATDISNWNGKSVVIANPTLAGTESDLTGLEIDGTKYKIPSGGSAGVSSLGGATGAITLGAGLAINDNQMRVVGSGTSCVYLLWTNPNPTSDFAAQTLSVDLTGYSLFGVEYKIEKGYASVAGLHIFSVGANSLLYWSNSPSNNMYSRRFNNTNVTDIVVADQRVNSSTVENDKLIPVRIFGII